MDLTKERIVVTGGAGFLGHHVVSQLKQWGCDTFSQTSWMDNYAGIFVPRSKDFDLTTEKAVHNLYRTIRPSVVIHLAAVVGGIGINKDHPGTFYYKNLMMGALLMEYARHFNVKKFTATGTICSYPNSTPAPFQEDDLWNGYPEVTNAPYGLAKKMMLVQSQAYRQEFGFNSIFLLPVNLYGPRDNFDLYSSHVIPALIRKCLESRDQIDCWGTGTATREFLYVTDAANAIVTATAQYNGPEPVNIGSGSEIQIAKLVDLIAEITEFKGTIKWDMSKPDGQPRRLLDVTRAKELFGFEAKVDLITGLRDTIDWYKKHKGPA